MVVLCGEYLCGWVGWFLQSLRIIKAVQLCTYECGIFHWVKSTKNRRISLRVLLMFSLISVGRPRTTNLCRYLVESLEHLWQDKCQMNPHFSAFLYFQGTYIEKITSQHAEGGGHSPPYICSRNYMDVFHKINNSIIDFWFFQYFN